MATIYTWIGFVIFWGAAMFIGSFIVGFITWYLTFDWWERRGWFVTAVNDRADLIKALEKIECCAIENGEQAARIAHDALTRAKGT